MAHVDWGWYWHQEQRCLGHGIGTLTSAMPWYISEYLLAVYSGGQAHSVNLGLVHTTLMGSTYIKWLALTRHP